MNKRPGNPKAGTRHARPGHDPAPRPKADPLVLVRVRDAGAQPHAVPASWFASDRDIQDRYSR